MHAAQPGPNLLSLYADCQIFIISAPDCIRAYTPSAVLTGCAVRCVELLSLACCVALLCRLLDQEDIIYILTLGVTEQYRHLGVASQLIQKVIQYAQGRLCRAVYLHVIDYNEAALNLYARNQFELLASLRNFYHIE